jgi:hypothetical protein
MVDICNTPRTPGYDKQPELATEEKQEDVTTLHNITFSSEGIAGCGAKGDE